MECIHCAHLGVDVNFVCDTDFLLPRPMVNAIRLFIYFKFVGFSYDLKINKNCAR